MRRAGLDWLTIAIITGHQSIENLIKHYDMKVKVRDKWLCDIICDIGRLPQCHSNGGSNIGFCFHIMCMYVSL